MATEDSIFTEDHHRRKTADEIGQERVRVVHQKTTSLGSVASYPTPHSEQWAVAECTARLNPETGSLKQSSERSLREALGPPVRQRRKRSSSSPGSEIPRKTPFLGNPS